MFRKRRRKKADSQSKSKPRLHSSMELAQFTQVSVVLAADRRQAVAVNTLLGLASLNEQQRPQKKAVTADGVGQVKAKQAENGNGEHEEKEAGSQDVSEDDGTYDCVNAEMERNFAFPGELATFYVLIEQKEPKSQQDLDQGKSTTARTMEDAEDMKRMCRSLDIMLNVSDETCHPSAVLLCPFQPSDSGLEDLQEEGAIDPALESSDTTEAEQKDMPKLALRKFSTIEAAATAKLAGIENLPLVKRLRKAYAVYYFQIDMPTTSSGGGASTAYQWSELELTLYCRHVSTTFRTRLNREAGRVSLAALRDADPDQFLGLLPRAQRVLESSSSAHPVERQTVEVRHTVRKERCVAIRSRYKQVNSKCFIEVSCENTHAHVCVVLKDLTLHTFTNRPISMRVTRLGRWVLPLELRPGERQTVCFLLSHFEDISPQAYVEPQEADTEGIGSRYTSIATVTWTSDVSVAEVRGKHRVEWDFASGVFDPVSLRLERDEGCTDLRPGDSFQLLLVVRNRAHAEVDLRVVLPAAEDMTSVSVIPLDASLHVGKVLGRAVEVPLRFMALRPGTADLAQLVQVYDSVTNTIIPVKEPHFVSIA